MFFTTVISGTKSDFDVLFLSPEIFSGAAIVDTMLLDWVIPMEPKVMESKWLICVPLAARRPIPQTETAIPPIRLK